MITSRVKKLRSESLKAKPTISTERAVLVTEAYRKFKGIDSTPILRALVFKHLMENKAVYIGKGELIVGEKGPAPKHVPTYPELCCHSANDLKILDSRAKIPFAADAKAIKTYQSKIIPFWKNKSIRDVIFSKMTKDWKNAYEAGMFTEFMEQRAPGHTVLDDKIYKKGFLDFKKDIQVSLSLLDFKKDPKARAKEQELHAIQICIDALIRFAERHAELALRLAGKEKDAKRRAELKQIAEICSHVPANPPRNFQEALQYYWFVHLGVTTELNTWDSFDPGRLDQHLNPFYVKDLASGRLTREKAEELLHCFWIKFNNQPAPPKVGVTAAESGTYTDFAQINTGGMKANGADGVNEVTYLLLDVIEDMRLLQPSSSIQVCRKNPDKFIKRAAKIIRTGFGQPSVFNADVIVRELTRQGKSLEDARNGGSSGCVEVGAFGKENYNLTGYFNIPKVLELTLNNGFDPRTKKQVGIRTGDPKKFKSFDQLFNAFKKQMKFLLDVKIRGNSVIEQIYAKQMPSPFMSILIDDCIATGKDYHEGGARYNTSYIMGVGTGTIADSMAAIKYHVYDKKTLPMDRLLKALKNDFKGDELMRQMFLNKTPKYGNDERYADDLMKACFKAYWSMIDGRKNTKGGTYHVNMLPTTCHVYFGAVMGASPDGRHAGVPLSEGISPVQGADRKGPTAVLKSAAKMDHARTGGTLLNQKFTPSLLKDDAGLDNMVHLVRSYFKMDGHHIQFNVCDADTLRDAQKNPEQYRDLIVRVAGYSDYFTDCSKALQDEIIARTEHKSF